MSITSPALAAEPTFVSGVGAAKILGISYRRIDHHMRTVGTLDGLQTPGSGQRRTLSQADVFSIAIIATIRQSLGSSVDFPSLLPSIYEAFEGDAQIVLEPQPSVGLTIDGTGIRQEIAEQWNEHAYALDDEDGEA